jgi:3-hydroxyacyl-[acyl-carrier-protein] dehydratase
VDAATNGRDFDAAQIITMIPHRFPFLMIDRVVEALPDKSAIGIKAVSVDEPYFQNQPRERLAMPGMLIVEAMAQTAAVLAVYTLGSEAAGKLVFFMGLQNVQFHRAVTPGDLLKLHVSKVRSFGPNLKLRGEAKVAETLVAEAFMTAMIADMRIES